MLVYKVENIKNHKIYIGITTKTLKERRKGHEHAWHNKKVTYFDQQLHEEGKENFSWEIIDESAKNLYELSSLEKFYIKKYNSFYDTGFGYNRTTGGQTFFELSDESKKLISERQKGKKNHMFNKYGKLNPASKMVYNVTDDIIYESGTDCIKKRKFTSIKIICCLQRRTTNCK